VSAVETKYAVRRSGRPISFERDSVFTESIAQEAAPEN